MSLNISVPAPTTAPTVAHAGGDDAAVWREQLGLLQAQQLGVRAGPGPTPRAPWRWLLREVLVDLLGADGAGALHRTGTVAIGQRFGCVGLGFVQAGACQRYIGLHAFRGKGSQHLAALHAVAHTRMQLGHAQAAGLDAHTGLSARRRHRRWRTA